MLDKDSVGRVTSQAYNPELKRLYLRESKGREHRHFGKRVPKTDACPFHRVPDFYRQHQASECDFGSKSTHLPFLRKKGRYWELLPHPCFPNFI